MLDITRPSSKVKLGLSIIVPTLNEEDNINNLFIRLESSLKTTKLTDYEIIFIDDHSTDKTLELCQRLASKNSFVRVKTKVGQPGKAFSLLEGIAAAQYSILCFIDADLQYPPEAIPGMVEKINNGSDVVIANRLTIKTSLSRKLVSKTFRFMSRLINNKKYDMQSGLKVFRADLLSYFELKPTKWTFDMELLAYAETLGAKIDSVDIEFAERVAGKSKLKITKGSYEILKRSLKLRFKPYRYIPFNEEMTSEYGHGFFYKGRSYIPHSNIDHHETALQRVMPAQILYFILFAILLLIGIAINWHSVITIIISIVSVMYFVDLLFNLFLIYRSFSKKPEIHISKTELKTVKDDEWPIYTVLCPLYRESAVLPQFVKAIAALDYPAEKLQVLLLLEEDDNQTIDTAHKMNLPKYFEIVIVPHSYPKTKPKACNYGLQVAKGEYVVIYDAEDVPNSTQLKEAYLSFKKLPDNIACVQGKLNFYNPRQNILTRAFTAEYSLWFDLVLTGLQSINSPIPLGGTSNHFKTAMLKSLGGWDAFNVTEDADLGIRIAKRGYNTAIMDAVTLEEANSQLKNWFWQRTRWIKGYIQTYLVHTRKIADFPKGYKRLHAITFQLIIGGKVLSIFINPLMWILTIVYFVFRPQVGTTIEGFFPAWVLYLAVFSLLFGNFLYLYYYMIGCAKRENYDLIKYAFLIPLYWLGMSLAGWVALAELFYKPHYWSKTKHGLHLNNATLSPALEAIAIDSKETIKG